MQLRFFGVLSNYLIQNKQNRSCVTMTLRFGRTKLVHGQRSQSWRF